MTRDKQGRYARKSKWFLSTMVIVLIIAGGVAYTGSKPVEIVEDAVEMRIAKLKAEAAIQLEARQAEYLQERIKMLQDSILHDLSIECEVKGVDEVDGIIVFDTNNKASIGRFQFQIATVQHYVKVFEDRNINKAEGISIAIDAEAATELARSIIFHETGGIWNWTNCANHLDLAPKITIIKELMK